jgi:hypothetical protein
MAHEISMGEDGILRLKPQGDMDRVAVETFQKDFAPYLEAATPEAPLLMLMDPSLIGKISSYARRMITTLHGDSRLGKTAAFNAPRRLRVFANFTNKATQRGNFKVFETEEEAVAWLRAKH